MAVRIYALAKELKIDSKALVDICTKAGISGKGSALASLTDDELTKVKAFMSGGGAAAAKGKSSPVLGKAKAGGGKQESGAVRREDYIAPGAAGKAPSIKDKPGKAKPSKGEPPKERPKTSASKEPAIKLAPLPEAEQPTDDPQTNEPAPQKPDLKLPADAIRASKAGSKPLAAHLRRHEKQREEETKVPTKAPVKAPVAGKRGAPPPIPEKPPLVAPGRGRGRRTKSELPEEKEKGGKTLLGGREQRQLHRKRSTVRGDEDERRPRRARRPKRTGANTAAPRKGKVTIQLPCTVRSFSEGTGVPVPEVMRILLREGVMATVNAELDIEMTEFIAEELEVDVEFRQPVRLEDQILAAIRDQVDDPSQLETRPPVITFLGHVDHGKTSLLDRIIGINVVKGESGGITQHIRAYQIKKDDRYISFVDTPGHEAFTEMRARGANVTDIAVLVVAADDGVMPQTEEAISHARAADVPIVVALNKIDLPGVDINRAMQQLSANELLPVEWGGDVEVVKTSAETGEGMDDLLETLLTVAELHDFKANPHRKAYGTCIESQQESGRGIVSKLMVRTGTLRVGDVLVCGQAFGRVKAMYDTLHLDKKIHAVGPSMPVNFTGLDIAPAAGEHFYVLDDISQARQIAENRAAETRQTVLGGGVEHVTLENLFERLEGTSEVQTLNMILRADVRGSIEAIQKELTKVEHPEVKIKVLQATVGGITEADVHLADASDAIIIGFNVVPDEGARVLADQRGVQVRRYDVIYKITDDLRAAVEGMLKPEQREAELGRLLVQQSFKISRVGTVAGCRVLTGTVERNARVRVIRDNMILGDYPIDTLRRVKDDVKEAREGMECGVKLVGFNDIKEGDVLEAYKIEEIGRKFDDK